MIKNDEKVVAQVAQKGKLFVLDCDTLESAAASEVVGNGAQLISQNIWHARPGNLPIEAMRNLEECNFYKYTPSLLIAQYPPEEISAPSFYHSMKQRAFSSEA